MGNEPEYAAFAARLKTAMAEQGIRPSDLARALGTDRATVSRWRSGKLHPGRGKLPLLAALLNKPVDYLLPRPPPAAMVVNSLTTVSDEELTRELERRLRRSGGDLPEGLPAPPQESPSGGC